MDTTTKKFTNLESLERTPNCNICSSEQFPVQPYREFVYFASENFFEKMADKTNLSLKDLYKFYAEDTADDDKVRKHNAAEKIAKLIVERIPGITYEISDEIIHQRIFSTFDIKKNNTVLCNLTFYNHMSFISPSKLGDRLWTACQFDFSMFDGFDFLELERDNNLLDFAKSDSDTETFDTIISCVAALANFTDYIKMYKAKKIMANNIISFIEKLVAGYVTDVQVLFGVHEFVIAALCGAEIVKNKYTYDNYLASIRDFADFIKNKYGDQFVKKEDTNEENKAQS